MNRKMTIELEPGDIFAWEQQWVEVKERTPRQRYVDLELVPLDFSIAGSVDDPKNVLAGEPFEESIPDDVEHEVQDVIYVVVTRSNGMVWFDVPLVTTDLDEAKALAGEIDGYVTTALLGKPWEAFTKHWEAR